MFLFCSKDNISQSQTLSLAVALEYGPDISRREDFREKGRPLTDRPSRRRRIGAVGSV
jgi:hypothetical protein